MNESKRLSNREKILQESVHLFNRHGVVPVTTNHVCKSLGLSPGNLYFHFKNREAITLELFTRMCEETYALWKKSLEENATPVRFIEESLEVFWTYRFFHREMYFLRRQDPRLNKLWHLHLQKTRRFMKAAHVRWVKRGWMLPIRNAQALRSLNDLLLVTASSFFQFYESSDKPATRRPLLLAQQYMLEFLSPHLSAEYRKNLTGKN
jgi:AcrR family transcriptional regulator